MKIRRFLYQKNVDYIIENSSIVIIDEFTGRKMPGRRWGDGLHQAIEAKEKLKIEKENKTYANITFQNFSIFIQHTVFDLTFV